MEKWTDNQIRMSVDEIIEDSFIMALPREKIREYLCDFLDSCDSVIRANLRIQGHPRITKVKISILKARLLANDNVFNLIRKGHANKDSLSDQEFLAAQVMRSKRLILRLLNSCSPSITKTVLHEFERRRRDREAPPRVLPYNPLITILISISLLAAMITAILLKNIQ